MDENEPEKIADSESAGDESCVGSACSNEGVILGNEGSSAQNEEKPCVPEDKIAALEAQNSELSAKYAELNNNYLRKAADFENFRKRTLEEKQKAIDFANQSLLLDIIPVLDDFERALSAADGAEKNESGFDSLCDGIKMIAQRLCQTLENKWALKSFVSKDEPFDPTRHEALMMEKSAEVKEAVVMEEFAKGYTLKDRVVRTAKVKVLMPGE